jgi:peptidase M1-like protein
MKKTLLSLSVAVFFFLSPASPALAAFENLEKSFNAFYATPLDSAGAVSVENLTLQKDAMTFLLKKGVLVPMQPVEGEITGAMFVGEGTATLTTPTPMDAWFLNKTYGSETFKENFTALYLRFDDGTEKSFPKAAPGTSQAVVVSQMETITRAFRERQGTADGWIDNQFDMDMDFLDTRLSGITGQNYLYAQFQNDKYGWMTFLYNDGDVIELSLGHDRTVGAYKQYLPWAAFHRKGDYQQGRYVMMPAADSKDVLQTVKTEMKVSIPTTKTVEIDARITIKPLAESLGSLRFGLVNQYGNVSWRDQTRPVKVTSVTDGQGNALPFLHKRDELLVRLPKPVRQGEEFILAVKASEDTIVQATAESYLLYNTYPWYPMYHFPQGRTAFDFSIEIQKPLIAAGSGHVVKRWENKETKMNGVELKMDEPVQSPSILFGRFLNEEGTFTSEVSSQSIAVGVYAFPTQTFSITDPAVLEEYGATTPISGTITVPPGKMKGVLGEAQSIIKFYEKLFGAFPYHDLQVAQAYPGFGFGQGPPGLVQLDGFAFQSQAELETDFLHEFLSHEIGHQYWGNCAGEASHRDGWISESFAEYSAGLYVQALLGEKRFQQKITDWRKNARQGDPMAPIAMAADISGDNAYRYYTQLYYDKGPLVVHMIRTQMGNDNFTKALQAVLTKYRNQNITTELLSKELGLVTGYNWDYFFDQWFRGVGIPEIHAKWKSTPKDGKYLFEMTLNQKDGANFKKILALPVAWHGASKDQSAQKDLPFAKQGQTFQLMLPFEPKEVEVDPNHNLLADIVMDK